MLALVRIDADAYDGVRDALESLYPRLSVGGAVIIDDWHLLGELDPCLITTPRYNGLERATASILEP